MKENVIAWEYMGEKDCLWMGTPGGIHRHVKFYIRLAVKYKDLYEIRSNSKAIPIKKCIGVSRSKEKAQKMLNTYELSNSIS